MKTIAVSELTGGEYLAKPVKLDDNQTLFYEGTCLYMKHIEALVSADIKEVVIFEPTVLSPKEKKVLREQLKADCSRKMRNVMEQYVTYDNGIKEISETANEIVEDMFSREEVVDRVYDIRERNADLYDHSVMVASLSILTALKMNLSQWEVYDIGVGSLLHDMGLRYLSTPYQDVDVEKEFDPESLFEYRKHTLYGFSSVEKETWMSNESKKIVLFHHERLDRSGFPFKHIVMPIGVRIVAIADAFDDILCGIGVKRGNVRQALEYIRNGRDILFEGRIVDYFLEFIAAYPVGTTVVTNKGDEAIVIEQNEHFTDRPKIKLIKDRTGKSYDDDKMIDLLENDDISIEHVKETG
jgi:HD-GYP domain-containing protein (c-di-GMP phosphodiesterase class II)